MSLGFIKAGILTWFSNYQLFKMY